MEISTSCRQFRASAKDTLKGHWGTSAITVLVYSIILLISSSISYITVVAVFFLNPILYYGIQVYFLNQSRGENMTLSNLFDGFQNYIDITFTYLLTYLYVILWSLLLIIPGIIKCYSYMLVFYIMKDYGLRYNDAIELSMRMMKGNKWKLFVLSLSFLGWFILGILSLGIGFLWITSYYITTFAKFYEEVKEKFEREQVLL